MLYYLKISLLADAKDLMGSDFTLHQDNASIHVSKFTKQWFSEKEIDLLEWPSISPDINPIENLWGILVRRVYAHGRQFVNFNDLKNAILVA